MKTYYSNNYNYIFNEKTGFSVRWGKTPEDNPSYSPVGPEILDIEISTICTQMCPSCYKSNTSTGKNMTLDTFKTIISKFPKYNNEFIVGQIALGIGSLHSNPDLFKIMDYCRKINVIPNLTINGYDLDFETAKDLSQLCGAIAISNYNKYTCYSAVEKLTNLGMRQINIHQILSEESYNNCVNLIHDCMEDEKLKSLNAVVLLMLKPKGRGVNLHPLRDRKKFKELIELAMNNNIRLGFDSCSAWSFLQSVENRNKYKIMCDPCESNRFSGYINVDGRWFHCSFCEGLDGFEGIDILSIDDFIKDVWYHPEVIKFRNNSIINEKKEISCQLFDLNFYDKYKYNKQ